MALRGFKMFPRWAQDHEKVVSKSFQKSIRFFIRFFIDFSSILKPTGDPKNACFLSFLGLAVATGPSWRQEGVQNDPRPLFSRISYHFGVEFGRIFGYFLRRFKHTIKKETNTQTTTTTEETKKRAKRTRTQRSICRGRNREAT